jgi:uncharacterized protein with beta-barrel porin domain
MNRTRGTQSLTATKRRVLRLIGPLFAALAAVFVAFAPTTASAQCNFAAAFNCVTPNLPPTSFFNDNTAQTSALLATLDLGSNFLQRLGKNSTFGGNKAGNSNPAGGGAPSNEQPRFRSWAEVYGLVSDTDAKGSFVGDRRTTYGGVAGIGVTLAPGFNVGVSVDQSRTGISVPPAMQQATMNLTQIGTYASYETGPWTFAAAAIYGVAGIESSRYFQFGGVTFGPHVARYDGFIAGGLFEVNYYWGIDQWRIVPKLAVEYTRGHTDAFTETLGILPITAAEANSERARVLLGAEVGRYWVLGRHVLDVSAYAKFVDNFHQQVDSVAVSSLIGAITVAGVKESTTGADAGGMLSFGITETARAYLAYDGKFRDGFTSHHGTVGLEIRW